MKYVLQALKVGNLDLANRLVMPPMATAKADADGNVNSAILDYYREKSAGGLSLIIIEHSYIQKAGKASENQLSIENDSVITGLGQLVKVIHGNGAKAVMQINHAGSATSSEITGMDIVGPSAVANPRRGGKPRELTKKEIQHIVAAFGEAARRTKDAGFDGVEIHSAHGYFLNQFFSPLTNKRSDEYGGSLKNRIRIHLEVIQAVRKTVGAEFPILLRLGVCDFTEGGTTIADSQFAAQEFVKAGVNILDISGGFSGYINPENSEQGYFAQLSLAIKNVVDIPVILTGGITDVHIAERLIEEGKADLIGVGRAVLQNSQWAREAIESISS
ncbi:NADH:flavin oxidoreductase [Dendrosporobacter sp. 1207_IL3150]|uniref:NADH:flavin oxidoreductase n=1 Tax=Dendrosporobacter sp. 1207_IL3150 TaxID=3084054 RepID=UPI002FDA6812